MNPMAMMQFKTKFERFCHQHPKVVAFFKGNHRELREGTVIEFRITTPEGKSVATNMRITADDEDTIDMIRKMLS